LRTSAGFRLVFASRTVTALGTLASDVAVLVQVKQLTGSPLAVGLLGVAELVPLVLFGLYGGVLADRFDRRALMRWCEAGLAVCTVLLLVNSLLRRPAVWAIYLLVAVMVSLYSLQRPSLDASLPRLVPAEQLPAAASLQSMSQNASFLLGSAFGGVLAVTPGPWLVYAMEAGGYVISFGLLSRLAPLPSLSSSPLSLSSPAGSVLGDLFGGLRYALGRRDLIGSYLADLAAMTFAYPNAMFPFLAVRLHASWSTGLMFAAPSLGALVVTVLSGWMERVRRHGLAIALAAAAYGAAIALLGLAPSLTVALGALVLAGAADMVSGIFRSTLWNQTIPDQLRGRLAGVELLSYGIGPPTGQLRSGLVASLAGVRVSLTSGGLGCVGFVALVCIGLPAFARYRAPDVTEAASASA